MQTAPDAAAPVQLEFTAKPGGGDFADCAGTYTRDVNLGTINGKAVYVNRDKERFLAATDLHSWCITALEYLPEILSKQGSFGGFHAADGDEPEDGQWADYSVVCTGRAPSHIRALARDASAWTKLENATVSFKAVRNSGDCRSERDFETNRLECLRADCGGFAWRKPHFNQFGEEDDPPVCFFFRRTQAELRASLSSTDLFDFYLAPDSFCPDCAFKPFRDPAPSCHVWWHAGGGVHAFAGQICVAEPSPYTYYMVCGFDGGYCGIQQHDGGKQQVLFSLWDHPSGSGRVENRAVHEDVVAKPFGGEGKGMGAYCISGTDEEDHELAAWLPGETYTFAVRKVAVEGGSEIACSLHKPGRGWIELARHFRPEPAEERGVKLEGLYSFIEDFAANGVRRSGLYAAWVQDAPGEAWRPVGRVSATAGADPDVPNKRVAPVSCPDGCQRIEMVSGGEALETFELFDGELVPPALAGVPALLAELE